MMDGCNKTKDDKVVINFWAMGVEGEQVRQLIPEFERRNPGIKIRAQQIPWSAAHEKLITAFAGETLPDAFQLGNTWVPEFVALNAIEQLNEFVKNSSTVRKDFYFEGIWDTNVIDSMVYGIPWYVDTRVLFYRKDILQKAGFNNPPKTWKELYEVSIKIKSLNQKHYAFFLPTNEWSSFIIFGMQNGATLLKDNYCYSNFSGDEFKEAFRFLTSFYYEGLAPVNMTQVTNIYQAFAEGFFAMFITGPWNVTEMKKRLPLNLQDSWMTVPLPSPSDRYPGISLAGGASLVINKQSKYKDAAWKWIEFLSEKETQLQFYKLVSSLPSIKDAWNDSTFYASAYMKAFYEQLQHVQPTPKIPEWEQIVFAKIQQYVEQVAAKKINVNDALQQLDDDVNKILEKRRWILSKR